MACATAKKLRQDPSLYHVAWDNLNRWKQTLRPWPPALREWEDILGQGQEAAITCLVEDSPKGRRLRQSHPFVGVLTPTERNAILQRYESISA